jgi:hypothetical protein
MPLRIDRVESEVEVLRKAGDDAPASSGNASGGGSGDRTISDAQSRAALRDKLRPVILEIVNDELARIKRKVGAP